MKSHAGTALAAAVLTALSSSPAFADEVIGYYPGWKSATFPVTAANVDASKLTMALYAFIDVCWDGKHGNPEPSVNDEAPCQDAAGDPVSPNGALVFRDAVSDGANLRALVALKKLHPDFKVVVSVGGWNWSNQFSNVADAPAARANFVASSVKLMRRFGLDGVDIDWEYPTEIGIACVAGRVCVRSQDKPNYVKLVRELRTAFDAAGKKDGKHYGVTIAAGGGASFISDGAAGTAWIKELSQSLDWINIMSYDYHTPSAKNNGHVAALHADAGDARSANGAHADDSVRRYLAAGIAADKLVMGVPFYGYGWKGCAPGPKGDGQYQPCEGGATGGVDGSNAYGFSYLQKQGILSPSFVGGSGYRRYWNASAKVPYLYNARERLWISYEDQESLREKARYIKARKLRGAMFWELSNDGKHQMLQTLWSEMQH